MAVNKCYECFDDELLSKIGPGAEYYAQRERYDLDKHDKPFTCIICGCKVNPGDY